jgi:hypothetical protein
LPLLKGTFHFNNIVLEGLHLSMIKNKDLNNWTFSNSNIKDKAEKSSLNFVINKLSLTNSQVKYTDLEKSNTYATKAFNLLINQRDGEIIFGNKQIEFNNASIDLNKNLLGTLNFKFNAERKPSYKGKFSIMISSVANLMNLLNVTLPSKLQSFTRSIKSSSNFTGTETNYNFDNLYLKLDDTDIRGSISIGINPYQINSDLKISKLDLHDFVNLHGLKLKIESIGIIEQFSTESGAKLSTLNGKGTISTGLITLFGLDIKKFSKGTTKVINDISIFKRLITYTRTIATIRVLKQEIDKINGKKTKNYADKTSLGQFNGAISAKNGIVLIKECRLDGNTLKGLCSGNINLSKQVLDLLIQGLILPLGEQSFINYIYFPYHITGRTNNLNTGLDWTAIARQTTNYYTTK